MALSHMHIRTYENTAPPQSEKNEPIQYGSLTVIPVLQSEDSVFGAEVSGVDWENPVPAETVAQVNRMVERIKDVSDILYSLSPYKISTAC